MIRKSSFLKTYKGKRGQIFLFSTLSRRIFLLDNNNSIKKIIKEVTGNPNKENYLINRGLLTKLENYEEEIREFLRLKDESNTQKLIIYFTITTDCDLKCPYCFEKHIPKIDSSQEIISRFSILLNQKLATDKSIKKVEVTLFGGEPLLRPNLCYLLLYSVKKICDSHKISYQFSMASNGILTKKEVLKNLKKYGLKNIQITFDGCQESHDKMRKIGNSSYKNLLKNIPLLEKHFKLILKYNIRKENVSEFKYFVKDIKSLNLKRSPTTNINSQK